MKQDVLVIGGELVLKLNKEVSSPGEAFQTFHETEDTSVASKLRGSIEKMTKRATRIRSDDRLADIAQNIETVQDVRALIQEVMTRNAVTTT
jgi:hypothetical protein